MDIEKYNGYADRGDRETPNNGADKLELDLLLSAVPDE